MAKETKTKRVGGSKVERTLQSLARAKSARGIFRSVTETNPALREQLERFGGSEPQALLKEGDTEPDAEPEDEEDGEEGESEGEEEEEEDLQT